MLLELVLPHGLRPSKWGMFLELLLISFEQTLSLAALTLFLETECCRFLMIDGDFSNVLAALLNVESGLLQSTKILVS